MLLGSLLLAAGGIYFYGQAGGDASKGAIKSTAPPTPAAKKPLQAAQQPAEVEVVETKGSAAAAGKAASRDFKPSMKRRPGETADPEKADPTLRTDLLAKLSKVHMDRVERSLFDFSSAAAAVPTVKLPEPKIVIRHPVKRMVGPEPPPPPPPPPTPAVKLPPPPIPLKFYGRALPLPNGTRRVFCLLNEEVNIPAEGDVIQKRYKIYRITATNVVVEDLNFNNRQTLPIEEPSAQAGF